VNAASRNVDVRVILNVDEEGAVSEAAAVNAAIGSYLISHNVGVKYDDPSVALHSKVLVIDKQYVVIGSHNWTAGSFYGYDDVSVFIDSAKLGDQYANRFLEMWAELD